MQNAEILTMERYTLKESVILEKSMNFSVRIVNMFKYLCNEQNEFVMSKQLLRSGTSIGANACEAHNAQSNKDFLAKMYIAYKESTETEYWLKLLAKTNYLPLKLSESILTDCVEIKKILTAIIKSVKSNSNKQK
ncbi:MAG: four helix bundle protein [Chitinispirillales bacterium]|jgi:four helix bundle protein|nr:four helix bundle protein [Chitinispirillales bacterium]